MSETHRSDKDRHLADEATEWFARLQSDQSTAEDRRLFQVWLAEDTDNVRAFEQVKALWSALDAPSRDIWNDLRTTHQKKLPDRSPWLYRWRQQSLAALAVAAVLFVSFYDVRNFIGYWASDYRTAYGEQRTLRLDDGSTVTMNTHSALSIRFTAERREIQLAQGEIYLNVKHDAQRPFAVRTRFAEVRDIGTQFDIYQRPSTLEVTVTEGEVAIARSLSPAVNLTAGWQTVVTDTGLTTPHKVDTQTQSTWTQGKLVFNLRPLHEVVTELNRYRTGSIVVLDPELRQRIVSGVFNVQAPESTLSALENTLRLNSIKLGSALTLLYPR